MVRVSEALKECGHGRLDVQRFHEAIVDVFHGLYRNVTPDDMLCQENEPALFVAAVRRRLRAPNLPHSLILRTLLKLRKSSAVLKREHRERHADDVEPLFN